MTKLQSKLDSLQKLYTEIDVAENDLSKDKEFIQSLFQPTFSVSHSISEFAKDIDSIEWVISNDLRYIFAEQSKWSEWDKGEVIFTFKLKRGKEYQVTYDEVKETITIYGSKNSLCQDFTYGSIHCFDDNCNPILTPELKEYLEKQSRAVRIGIMLFLNSCRQD